MADAGADSQGATDGRLALLSDVLRSFADATTDYPRLLETIATRTATLLGHYCSIRLISDDEKQLDSVALFDPLEGSDAKSLAALSHAPYPLGISPALDGALASGKAVLLGEVADEFVTPFEDSARAQMAELQVRCILIAPLHARGRAYGAFFVIARGSCRTLARQDVELAEALARHAALAISNGRLFQQLTREVQERQRAQSSLAAVEIARQYEKSIVDTIPHPLVTLSSDRRIRSANRTFLELFRVAEHDIMDQPLTEIAGGALGSPRVHQLLSELFPVRAGSLVTDIQVVVDTPALGRRTMLVNARKMYRPGNHTDTVLLALEDVTERLQAAEMLERRALLLEWMSEAVIAGDLEFRIHEWNPAAERLFGWTATEARGRRIEELLEVRGANRDDARDKIRAGDMTRLSVRMKDRHGRWLDVEASSMPVKLDGVTTGFVSVLHDVTERRRLEQEAFQRVHELQIANRELESFSYSVSHDLRAPVRAIAGFARLLEEDHGAALDAEGLRLLEVVRRNAQRMGLLIDDLLAFARTGRQAITREHVDMETLAREAADEACRAEAERDFDVRIGHLPAAAADKSLLAQVWQNLLTNAVKYSRGRSPAIIEVDGEVTGDEVAYQVRDNGVGFDMRHAGKLFGVFERLHTPSQFEGTGVGLALVDRIIRRHGGRVWAEAEPDKGATFHFSLPKGAAMP